MQMKFKHRMTNVWFQKSGGWVPWGWGWWLQAAQGVFGGTGPVSRPDVGAPHTPWSCPPRPPSERIRLQGGHMSQERWGPDITVMLEIPPLAV